MTFHNKLQSLSLASLSMPSLMFVGKARGQCYKTFYGRKLRIFISQPLQPSHCLLVKQVPTPLKNLSDAPLWGRLLALLTNNRLSWKGLPGTNTSLLRKCVNRRQKSFITLAPGNSYGRELIAGFKCFILQTPGTCIVNLFTVVIKFVIASCLCYCLLLFSGVYKHYLTMLGN